MGAANTKEAQPTACSRSANNRPDIFDAERRENDLRWEKAENFAAVIRLNRSFLHGETRSTVYHGAPVDSETLPLVESLLRLHDFGILTYTGQPQLQENPEFITVNGRSFWYGTKQRAFLCFLVPRLEGPISSANLRTFCDLLLRHPSVVTHIVDDSPERTPRSAPAKIQSNTVEEHYPLTLERKATTAEELERAEFSVYTGIPGWIKEAEWPSFRCNAIDRAWPLEITVAARQWDEPLDLEALIESLAVASGMSRAYAE